MFLLNHPALTRVAMVTSATLLPMLALAHEGHGMGNDAHWHASDTLGFVLVAAVAAVAAAGIWWSRRK